MNLTDTHKALAALAGTAVMAVGAVGYFQTRAQADQAQQQQAKSVNELRAEMYLARIKQINEKPSPSKDELDEKERLLALVKAIEAERVRK